MKIQCTSNESGKTHKLPSNEIYYLCMCSFHLSLSLSLFISCHNIPFRAIFLLFYFEYIFPWYPPLCLYYARCFIQTSKSLACTSFFYELVIQQTEEKKKHIHSHKHTHIYIHAELNRANKNDERRQQIK